MTASNSSSSSLASTTFPNSGGLVQSTLHARWLILVSIIASTPWHQPGTTVLALTVFAGIAYTGLLEIITASRISETTLGIITLSIDYLLLTIFIMITGGLHSPYYFLLAAPLMTVGYWYRLTNLRPSLLLGALGVALLALVSMWTPFTVIQYDSKDLFLATSCLLIALGFLAYDLAKTGRADRNRANNARHMAELQQTRLEVFLNSISEAVLVIDDKGVISLHNAAALRLLDIHNIDGLNIAQTMPLADDEGKTIDIIEVCKNVTIPIERNDLHFKSDDGSTITLDMSIAPVHSRATGVSDEQTAYVLVMRDITRAKQAEEEREEFIAVTSHELRTPVATAEASLSILLTPKLGERDPEVAHWASLAHENIVFLGQLIADLSTLAHLDQKALEFKVEEVNPDELLRRTAETFKPLAHDKGLQLTVYTDPDLPIILSSQHLIKEILQNFISNALKYTLKGTITLSAIQATAPDKGIVFSVQDTGIGIAASDKTQVFQKFFRSEDYRTRSTGGTGLGLYLCRRLAERLNGRVWFESKLDKGSTFYLLVPPASNLEEDREKVRTAKIDNLVNNL